MINITNRFFLVGVPRSGTTLLQSFLSAHSQINSFPETHFFSRIVDIDEKMIKYKIPFFNNLRYCRLKNKIGLGKCYLSCVTMKCLVQKFVHDLDELTIQKNKFSWVEKTPEHLHHIETIQDNVEGVRFIHIIRNGQDVVASLYKATKDYPLEWGGKQRIVPECVDRWNKDMKLTESYLKDKENHFMVKYEDLVTNPEYELKKMFKWMKIDFESEILERYSQSATELIGKDEKWKQNNFEKTIRKKSNTYDEIFSLEEKKHITQNLYHSIFYKTIDEMSEKA